MPTASWSHVQSAATTTASGTTASLSFGAPITNGNIVVGAILEVNGALPTGITDDKNNSYVFVNSGSDNTVLNTVTGFRSLRPITNGARTLTFTYQSATTVWLLMDEFSAGIPLTGISVDGSQLTINTTGPTPNFQTLQSNDLQYCAVFGAAAATVGAGWTVAQGNSSQQLAQWKQVASPGSANNAAFTTSAGAWVTVFGIAANPQSGWELRQNQIQRTVTNATVGSVSFPHTVAAGNVVIGSVAIGTEAGTDDQISNITSLNDDKGNSYSILNPNLRGRAIFWSNGPLRNGPRTITCTCSRSEVIIYFLVNEFSPPPGAAAFAVDGAPVTATLAGPTPPFSSGTVTTLKNGDLVYGFIDAGGASSRPNNGFSTLNGQFMTWCDAFLIQPSAGAVSASWMTGAGTVNAIALAAFSSLSGFDFSHQHTWAPGAWAPGTWASGAFAPGTWH